MQGHMGEVFLKLDVLRPETASGQSPPYFLLRAEPTEAGPLSGMRTQMSTSCIMRIRGLNGLPPA